LYARVIDEFADISLPNPFPHPTSDRLLPGRPVTYGDAARLYSHELRYLGIGRPAPEKAVTALSKEKGDRERRPREKD